MSGNNDEETLDLILSQMGGSPSKRDGVPLRGEENMPRWLVEQVNEKRALTYAQTDYLANIIRGMGVIDATTAETFEIVENLIFDQRNEFTDPERRKVFNMFLANIIPESLNDMMELRKAARELLKATMTNPFITPAQKKSFLQRLLGD